MFGNLTDEDSDTVMLTTNRLIETDPHAELLEAITHGYAGILPNGNIVDRRKISGARPIASNSLLNVGSPKEVES